MTAVHVRRAALGSHGIAAIVTACLLTFVGPAAAQRGRGMIGAFGDPNDYYTPPAFHGNVPYDGRVTFARIKYRGYAHFTDEGPGWSHDYPTSETHLMKLLRELTTIRPFISRGDITGGNVFALDDPELMKYPIAYFSEPGGWTPNDKEIAGFRNYLRKGGFVVFDDFGDQGGRGDLHDWNNTVAQLARVMPDARLVRLDERHPIFHAFYDIELNIIPRTYRGVPSYWGLFEHGDPRTRMLAILNRDNDIGEFWEFSDQGFAPVAESNEAYKLGINYFVYALTH